MIAFIICVTILLAIAVYCYDHYFKVDGDFTKMDSFSQTVVQTIYFNFKTFIFDTLGMITTKDTLYVKLTVVMAKGQEKHFYESGKVCKFTYDNVLSNAIDTRNAQIYIDLYYSFSHIFDMITIRLFNQNKEDENFFVPDTVYFICTSCDTENHLRNRVMKIEDPGYIPVAFIIENNTDYLYMIPDYIKDISASALEDIKKEMNS